MNRLKKTVASITLFATLNSSLAFAQENFDIEELCYEEVCYEGCAYEDCRTAPTITPQMAVGAIAVVSTIAVMLHRTKHKHMHNHNHSHSHSHS